MDKRFKTADIQLAAALLTSGCVYITTEPDKDSRGGRAFFVFEDNDDIDQLTADYMNDTMALPPRELFARMRELKGMASNATGGARR